MNTVKWTEKTAGSGKKKGKGIVRAGSGNKKGKEIVRSDSRKQWDF